MDWIKILYLIVIAVNTVLIGYEDRLIRKTKANLVNTEGLLKKLREMPEVVPCYECKYYEEGVLFCPKSDMRMKDGLIFCCYGERKEATDEGNVNDNGCR
jgi:hypothetical protein